MSVETIYEAHRLIYLSLAYSGGKNALSPRTAPR
jgi:hypothetical protein